MPLLPRTQTSSAVTQSVALPRILQERLSSMTPAQCDSAFPCASAPSGTETSELLPPKKLEMLLRFATVRGVSDPASLDGGVGTSLSGLPVL